ncbi:Patatin-like phospholipase [Lentzea albidocapillata subsp. violacea]|uniref:Patatin-like phospholipase n=1 Tax=Lentzea albidocapillata subsp. violacea TaxID=128104 RepID=A0A1G8QGS8_9PSEU|nr:patatin-like phospholipase family protein [Lentzea albidocapillata]SDJ03773.1 Patatin-like phospholipase [Lentzea albidocapillata subsp. violacea]
MKPDEVLHALPTTYAQALHLRELGASAVEIAHRLDVPVDSVDALLRLAEAKLASIRHRGETDMRTVGLALSGGGARGDFQLGALKYLYEETGLNPQVIAGVSVGAVNGTMLAHGPQYLSRLESIWRGLASNDSFYLKTEALHELERLLGGAPSLEAVERALRDFATRAITAGGAAGIATLFLGPLGFLLGAAGAALDLVPTIQHLVCVVEQFGRTQSIYHLGPTRGLVAGNLDTAALAASGIELRMGMVGLESGALRFVDQHGRFTDNGEGPVDLVDAILASSSIPVAFPPVSLGAGTYVDGGVREVCPVRAAVEAGADYVWAIGCSALGAPPDGSFGGRGTLDIAFRANDIAVDEVYRSDIDPDPAGWGHDVRVVVPSINVHDPLTVDPALIAIAIDYGWMTAADEYRRSIELVPSDAVVAVAEHLFARGVEALFSDQAAAPQIHVPDRVERYRQVVKQALGEGREGVDLLVEFDRAALDEAIGLPPPSFGVPADRETLSERLAERLERRPRTRAEQLATHITALRMQLALYGRENHREFMQDSVGQDMRAISMQALVDAVNERRRVHGELPAGADSWGDV